ncbi:FAD-dependent oxidoreductase [Microbacterium sp.]|uniref:FAD-dependent oxidoreductase n=1 Tax=Microbacterium sp. TaxID=51671 RepID=UPI0037C6C759
MSKQHAEIAGAGLAGLTAAAALGRLGWSVRVHERGTELREIGAGIYMWENGLRALEAVGAYSAAVANAEAVSSPVLRDHKGRILQREWLRHGRLFTMGRQHLHACLVDAAREAGAELVTGSPVAGATDGVLQLESGETLEADLVIGADGIGSRVRDSLGLLRESVDLGDGGGRYMIPRNSDDPVGEVIEQWNGGRRIGIVPVSADFTYIFLCCRADDERGVDQVPFTPETWIESFPEFESQLRRIPAVSDGRWVKFRDIRTTAWHRGRAAILGDAAHGMSPNLGQAACVSLTNAVALSRSIEAHDSLSEALTAWELTERPIADDVQRFSRLYGRIGTKWPDWALGARSVLVRGLGSFKPVQRRINFAATYFPEYATTRSSA